MAAILDLAASAVKHDHQLGAPIMLSNGLQITGKTQQSGLPNHDR